LDDSEARAVADRFGVAIEQVRRDPLISHILAALGASHGDQLIFFGGTAWDLWALASRGEINQHAAKLFVAHGPIGKTPQPWMFTSAPTEDRWQAQLGGQTRLTTSAADALQIVADAWASASSKIALLP
jgi:hypothetical protein